MKICVAQTRPFKGDVQANIEGHKKLIELADSCGAELVIFPELSLTGYEPELAEELATDPDDSRFDVFQDNADSRRKTIGVGVPTRSDAGIRIGMVLFQPQQADGVEKAARTLAEIAKKYSMTVFMSNCLGSCGGTECAGNSSIWNYW